MDQALYDTSGFVNCGFLGCLMKLQNTIPLTKCKGGKSKFEVRSELVRYGLTHGIRKTCRTFGCSHNTVRLWLRRYREEGVSEFQGRSNAPKHIPHKIPVYLEKQIIDVRKKFPYCGAGRLKEMFSLKPSKGAIARILRQNNLTGKPPKRRSFVDNMSKELQDKIYAPRGMGQHLPVDSKETPTDIVRLYKSLGDLIKEYRQWRRISQEQMAFSIEVSVRELNRWETNRSPARMENLHDLSEVTGIPMQVCVALNADQPIWYSLRKRLFSYSLIEGRGITSTELLKYQEQTGDATLINENQIRNEKHISSILSYCRDIYGTGRILGRDVIKTASTILPDLNHIFFDSWGHHVGHMVCLPIKIDVYQKLKKQRGFERYLTTEALSDIVTQRRGVFFYYSLFGASPSATHRLIMNGVKFHAKIAQKERYLAANYAITKEVKEACKYLGMKIVFNDKKECERKLTETIPTVYEMRFDLLTKSHMRFMALESSR